jgi:hypothetical protein
MCTIEVLQSTTTVLFGPRLMLKRGAQYTIRATLVTRDLKASCVARVRVIPAAGLLLSP